MDLTNSFKTLLIEDFSLMENNNKNSNFPLKREILRFF